ncbi:protocatechuate 3,4-dioxygenase beta subunit [Flavobacteriaceae bacterium MAR_2010_188]|nr:protocatechuate 3,4-dioxygenase beta subunit [Flavobacteriaceae bacterium MAR_2010_188]
MLSFGSCQSQTKNPESKKLVGGPCEGCEAIFEYADKKLKSSDTLKDFQITEPKLKLTGTVFKKDGKTPANDVILYIYHTNRKGIYPTKGNEKAWAKRHGYIRGWAKTDKWGNYSFYTFRPAAYPNRNDPAHIHITVKEPNKNEYYIDEFLFEDDPLLTKERRNNLENRGGSGIVNPELKVNLLTVTRDIILGLNIPNYE